MNLWDALDAATPLVLSKLRLAKTLRMGGPLIIEYRASKNPVSGKVQAWVHARDGIVEGLSDESRMRLDDVADWDWEPVKEGV